jgi:threonine/homoserine/homoserine lactone efflux protein
LAHETTHSKENIAMTAVALMITIAAITPGPNNLIILRRAAQSGFRASLPLIAAVVLGGLCMLVLVIAGFGTLLRNSPSASALLSLSGCAYLCWLGLGLLRHSIVLPRQTIALKLVDEMDSRIDLPIVANIGALKMFGLQFLNPKAWLMVLTAFAAIADDQPFVQTQLTVVLMFAVIPTICLSLWSVFGTLLAEWLAQAKARAWLDRVMGVSLIAFALQLSIESGVAL